MANLPFFRFPYHNYYYPYYPNYQNKNDLNLDKTNKSNNNLALEENKEEIKKETRQQKNKSSKYNSFGPIKFSKSFFENDLNEPIVEILGIQLYLDDIIILGLLFFLYKEDVHDEMLFLALVLLLLT